jgi:hypothetical protein
MGTLQLLNILEDISTGKAKIEVVAKTGIKKQGGYLYFIDKQGDISCAKMVRGGKRREGDFHKGAPGRDPDLRWL